MNSFSRERQQTNFKSYTHRYIVIQNTELFFRAQTCRYWHIEKQQRGDYITCSIHREEESMEIEE